MERRYPSPAEAETVRAAIAVDDPGYVDIRARGRSLLLTIRADSAASARRTVDDLLSAVAVAERTLGILASPSPTRSPTASRRPRRSTPSG